MDWPGTVKPLGVAEELETMGEGEVDLETAGTIRPFFFENGEVWTEERDRGSDWLAGSAIEDVPGDLGAEDSGLARHEKKEEPSGLTVE
jgi:hypothetical protein